MGPWPWGLRWIDVPFGMLMCLPWKLCGHGVDVPFGDLMGLRAPARRYMIYSDVLNSFDTPIKHLKAHQEGFFPMTRTRRYSWSIINTTISIFCATRTLPKGHNPTGSDLIKH